MQTGILTEGRGDVVPTFVLGDYIKSSRVKKSLSRDDLLFFVSLVGEESSLSDRSLQRIETNRQKPQLKNFMDIMKSLKLPMATFYFPYLEGITREMLVNHHKLEFCTMFTYEDDSLADAGEGILLEVENSGLYETGLNRQYFLSRKAAFMTKTGKSPMQAKKLAEEALRITYPEFDAKTKTGGMFFEEPVLMATLAVAYHELGNFAISLDLLVKTMENIEKLPQENKHADKALALCKLNIAKNLKAMGRQRDALDYCEKGLDFVRECNVGHFAPDFMRLKCHCLHELGNTEDLRFLLTQAYAGYMILSRYRSADELFIEAKKLFGVEFTTYGMENLRKQVQVPDFTFHEIPACKSLKELLSKCRYNAGISMEELCSGICSKGTLGKLETSEYEGNYFQVEALTERLGLDLRNYLHHFMSLEEFQAKRTRDLVRKHIARRNYDAVPLLLAKLYANKEFKSDVCKQFLLMAQASVDRHVRGTNMDKLNKHFDILRLTKKDFDIGSVAHSRFTQTELTILMQISNCMYGVKDYRGSFELYEGLIKSMDKFYTDCTEKRAKYTAIVSNYASLLEQSGRIDDALYYTELGMKNELSANRISALSFYADNLACCELKQGNKELSAALSALAYYSIVLIGRFNDASYTKKFAENVLKVNFI